MGKDSGSGLYRNYSRKQIQGLRDYGKKNGVSVKANLKKGYGWRFSVSNGMRTFHMWDASAVRDTVRELRSL